MLCVVMLSVLKLIGLCAECGVHIVMLNVIVLGVVAPLQVPSGSRIQTCDLGPMLKKFCP